VVVEENARGRSLAQAMYNAGIREDDPLMSRARGIAPKPIDKKESPAPDKTDGGTSKESPAPDKTDGGTSKESPAPDKTDAQDGESKP
jgi:hypothetical protein